MLCFWKEIEIDKHIQAITEHVYMTISEQEKEKLNEKQPGLTNLQMQKLCLRLEQEVMLMLKRTESYMSSILQRISWKGIVLGGECLLLWIPVLDTLKPSNEGNKVGIEIIETVLNFFAATIAKNVGSLIVEKILQNSS